MELESEPSRLVSTLLSSIDTATGRFSVLLDSEPREEEVQRFLADNPVLLHPTALKVSAKVKLGAEDVTDFVIELSEQEYVLVELEPPGQQMFTKNGDPSRTLSHAQRQVQNWREWIQDNTEYARRRLPGIADPECWVVVGRRNSMTAADIRLLARMNKDSTRIRIKTYDDLLESISRYQNSAKRLLQSQGSQPQHAPRNG